MAARFAPNWWALALRGVLAIIFGILALVWPGLTLGALVLLFGAYIFVDGIFAIAAAVAGEGGSHWWALVIEGILGLMVGVLTFLWPSITLVAWMYVIGFWAIATGVFEIIAAIRLRRAIEGEWWLALSGLVSLLLGIAFVIAPIAGAVAITWLIGVYSLVFGVFLILAIRLRRWGVRSPMVSPF